MDGICPEARFLEAGAGGFENCRGWSLPCRTTVQFIYLVEQRNFEEKYEKCDGRSQPENSGAKQRDS